MDRDEFMEIVYETFADEPDNVLANGIIEAADAYVEHEKAQLFLESTTSDLISRQQAIDALDCINGVEEVLRSLPSIQPEPADEQVKEYCKRRCLHIVTNDFFRMAQPEQKEGHWIEKDGFDGDTYYDCSVCGNSWTTIDGTPMNNDMNYCPKCGARMKGERT